MRFYGKALFTALLIATLVTLPASAGAGLALAPASDARITVAQAWKTFSWLLQAQLGLGWSKTGSQLDPVGGNQPESGSQLDPVGGSSNQESGSQLDPVGGSSTWKTGSQLDPVGGSSNPESGSQLDPVGEPTPPPATPESGSQLDPVG